MKYDRVYRTIRNLIEDHLSFNYFAFCFPPSVGFSEDDYLASVLNSLRNANGPLNKRIYYTSENVFSSSEYSLSLKAFRFDAKDVYEDLDNLRILLTFFEKNFPEFFNDIDLKINYLGDIHTKTILNEKIEKFYEEQNGMFPKNFIDKLRPTIDSVLNDVQKKEKEDLKKYLDLLKIKNFEWLDDLGENSKYVGFYFEVFFDDDLIAKGGRFLFKDIPNLKFSLNIYKIAQALLEKSIYGRSIITKTRGLIKCRGVELFLEDFDPNSLLFLSLLEKKGLSVFVHLNGDKQTCIDFIHHESSILPVLFYDPKKSGLNYWIPSPQLFGFSVLPNDLEEFVGLENSDLEEFFKKISIFQKNRDEFFKNY